MAWHSGKPADNDFLSASVRHIRENFAELEPLHPHAAELVDLTALHPHVAELVDLTALHPYINALLSSRIVDHNLDVANAPNGRYVRLASGLQVCYGVRTFEDLNCGAQIGTSGWYRNLSADGIVTLPAQFASTNDYVPIPVEGPWVSPYGPTGLGVTHAFTLSANSFSIYVSRFGSGVIPSINIGWVAIGRWQ